MPDHKNPKLEPSKDPKNPKGSQNKRSAIVSVILTVLILCALGYMLMGRSVTGADQTDTLETSQFTAAVNQGRVTEVSYTPGQYAVSGKYYPAVTAGSQAAAAFNDAFSALNTQLSSKHNAPASVTTTTLDSQFLGDQRNFTSTSAGTSIEALMQEHPEIQYNVQVENSMWGILASAIPMLILCGLMIFFFWQMGKANNSQMSFGKARAKKTNEERPDVRFSDVAGCDEAVEEMKEIRDYLANPTKYQAIGAKVPHGCLLVGPPGTGKTLLAKAVAGEANVPFFSISGSDFVEMFVGVGASRVRDLFQQAKEAAPSIIFIDEIDAVGRQRGTGLGGGHDEREQTLNQLLVEMDGFDANTSVVLIAATNRADVLDPALLRPGRFDRQIVVDAPDVRGREKILKVHARNKPIAKDVDLSAIAKLTPGFTGADLANLLNEAALLTARRNKTVISMDEVQESMERVIAGPERRGRIMDEQTRKTIAYHESGHALVGHLLPLADPVHKITIVSRGRALGYTMSIPKEDKVMNGLHEMQQELAVYLGGRVSEEIFCDDITTGASNDLERATKMARAMVTQYGMSSDLGVQIFGQPNHEPYLGRDYGNTQDYSDETARRIDDEVARIMRQAHDTAYKILTEHKDQMHLMASVLLERETVDGAACQALLDNKWDEYLAQESSEEGRKAREEAATTVVNQEELPDGDTAEAEPEAAAGEAPAVSQPANGAEPPQETSGQNTADAAPEPQATDSADRQSQSDSDNPGTGTTEK